MNYNETWKEAVAVCLRYYPSICLLRLTRNVCQDFRQPWFKHEISRAQYSSANHSFVRCFSFLFIFFIFLVSSHSGTVFCWGPCFFLCQTTIIHFGWRKGTKELRIYNWISAPAWVNMFLNVKSHRPLHAFYEETSLRTEKKGRLR
jgi:hypothetical protein